MRDHDWMDSCECLLADSNSILVNGARFHKDMFEHAMIFSSDAT